MKPQNKMAQFHKQIALTTSKQFEMVDITKLVRDAVAESGIHDGQVLVYNPHTTSSIRLNHNEPLLLQDIMKALYHTVPIDMSYSHDVFEIRQNVAVNERSNGHAHVKAFLLGSSETLPLVGGELKIGEKQSIFFVELDGGRSRDFYVNISGG